MSKCILRAIIYKKNGEDVAVGSELEVFKVMKSGKAIKASKDIHTLADALGNFRPPLEIERGSDAFMFSANIAGIDKNKVSGSPVHIPDVAEADLIPIALAGAPPPPSQVAVAIPPEIVPIEVATSTKAELASLPAGSVAIVTDEERGVWYRYNSQSTKLGGPRIYMRDFALANGSNQSSGINAAIAQASAKNLPIELEADGIYGISSPLDGSVRNVALISPNGRAIIKALSSNKILDTSNGRYDGWRFGGIEFQGVSLLYGSRDVIFDRPKFRADDYALVLYGAFRVRLLEPEFYGTRAGVMTASVQDPTPNTGAVYGSGLRVLSGVSDLEIVRPLFHFCLTGIGADVVSTQAAKGVKIEGGTFRGDWWNSPFVIKRITPTAYNSGTSRMTVGAGGLTGYFDSSQFHMVSVPIVVSTGSSFTSVYVNTVSVTSGFTNARRGDVIETGDGRRAEIIAKESSTVVDISGWESIDTFEPCDAPGNATSWRLVRYYGAAGTFVDDTHVDIYGGDFVNVFTGERLVADAGLSPVGISCKVMATLIYSGVAVNANVYDFSIRKATMRGARADQVSIFDTPGPRIVDCNFQYGFDEGITLTRAPNAIACDNNFEQCGVSAVALGSDYATIEGNSVNNWGIVNRAGLGAIDNNGKFNSIRGNVGTVSPFGAGSGALYFITFNQAVAASGCVVEGNCDGGARVATMKVSAESGPFIARDVESIAGPGRDRVLVAPGEHWNLKTGLVEHFKFEDALGSKLGLSLTNHSSVTFTAGKVGNAATFSGSNYLSSLEHAIFGIGGDVHFEFALWVKFTSLSDSQVIGKYAGTNTYFLQINSSRFTWAVNNGTVTTAIGANTFGNLSTGTWYFVRCGYDHVGGQIFIQVNNGGIDTTAHIGGCIDGLDAFGVGARSDGYNPMSGQIDELSLWKGRKLDPADVTKLYNSGSGLVWPWL